MIEYFIISLDMVEYIGIFLDMVVFTAKIKNPLVGLSRP
jgi:hypothetical protein